MNLSSGSLKGTRKIVIQVLEGDSELVPDGLGKLLQQLNLPGVSPHSPQHTQHGLLLQRPGDPLLLEHRPHLLPELGVVVVLMAISCEASIFL